MAKKVVFRMIATARTTAGEKPDLYALADDGALWRRSDGTWTLVESPEVPAAAPTSRTLRA
jgi:hypothetical protein